MYWDDYALVMYWLMCNSAVVFYRQKMWYSKLEDVVEQATKLQEGEMIQLQNPSI
jgi:hypothetical protein